MEKISPSVTTATTVPGLFAFGHAWADTPESAQAAKEAADYFEPATTQNTSGDSRTKEVARPPETAAVVDAFRTYNRRGSACSPTAAWTAGAPLGHFVGLLGHHDG